MLSRHQCCTFVNPLILYMLHCLNYLNILTLINFSDKRKNKRYLLTIENTVTDPAEVCFLSENDSPKITVQTTALIILPVIKANF